MRSVSSFEAKVLRHVGRGPGGVGDEDVGLSLWLWRWPFDWYNTTGGGGGARVSGFGIRDVEDLDRCSNQPLQFSELMMRTRLSRYSFASTVELSVPACRCG